MKLRPHAYWRVSLMACLASVWTLKSQAEYLFVHFKMEANDQCEQIYFGVSQDGYAWETVNQDAPVLVSTLGEKGVRDPHIIRSPDNKKFYLVATDLLVFRNRNWTRNVQQGSRAVIVWESDDLVKWSEPRRVEVSAEDAGCTWAPEMMWDAKRGEYLMYWASTTKRDEFKKQRIWAATTKDFKTFSQPFMYIERGMHVIDTTIVKDGDVYYRFSKDERGKAITMEKSLSLTEGWQTMEAFSLKGLVGYEGPTCYQMPDGSWCLLLDYYSKGQGYKAFFTKNIASGQFVPDTGQFKMPYKYRHGTVMKITAEEYTRLKNMGDTRTPPSRESKIETRNWKLETGYCSVVLASEWREPPTFANQRLTETVRPTRFARCICLTRRR